jgi:protein-S-isoprenylcysteine O-methyltransferase Ste14
MVLLVAGLALFAALALVVLQRQRTAEVVDLPLVLATWCAYVVHADAVAIAVFLDAGRLDLPRVAPLVLGLSMAAAGLVLFAWATRVLVRDADFEGFEPTRRVTAGPYGWMRHPQDTGWALLLLGSAIAAQSVIGLGLMLLFAVFIRRLWTAEGQRLDRQTDAAP